MVVFDEDYRQVVTMRSVTGEEGRQGTERPGNGRICYVEIQESSSAGDSKPAAKLMSEDKAGSRGLELTVMVGWRLMASFLAEDCLGGGSDHCLEEVMRLKQAESLQQRLCSLGRAKFLLRQEGLKGEFGDENVDLEEFAGFPERGAFLEDAVEGLSTQPRGSGRWGQIRLTQCYGVSVPPGEGRIPGGLGRKQVVRLCPWERRVGWASCQKHADLRGSSPLLGLVVRRLGVQPHYPECEEV